jgi:hypothetical protein
MNLEEVIIMSEIEAYLITKPFVEHLMTERRPI